MTRQLRMLLLAALVLLARLIGPTMQAEAAPWLDDMPICHAGDPTPDQPAPHRHDCLECLACHVVGHAVFVAPAPMPLPRRLDLRPTRYAMPPAIGPPARTLPTSSPPTGPPYAAI
ncbi:hypothetical protein [Acidisphaera sp. L21]|uniref:hypothetical protein n=1 Tax=Acidisphaera sp. L21 TaxID=1641851 RepID=UPI00131D63B2|nr:hypothetical protein [Acidisphaera sp. L21]